MKLGFTLQLDKDVRTALEETAGGAHTDATKYAAQVLAEVARLKPEYALRWIAHIPMEYYRRGPGRPATSAKKDKIDSSIAVKEVA